MKTTIIITMAVLTVIILAYIAYEMKHAYTLQDEDENEEKATTEGSETKSSKEGEKRARFISESTPTSKKMA